MRNPSPVHVRIYSKGAWLHVGQFTVGLQWKHSRYMVPYIAVGFKDRWRYFSRSGFFSAGLRKVADVA